MRALVLSGGGCKGAFQVGAIKKLVDTENVEYDIFCGVSVGAINSAGLAQFQRGQNKEAAEHLELLWRTRVDTPAIHKPWWPLGKVHSFWEKSMYDSSPLRDFMYREIDVSKIRATGKQVAVGAVSLVGGKYHFGTQDDDNFVDWVLASSSFPIFLNPIEIDGDLWSDGGLQCITPLGQAIRMGATDIDVVLTYDPDAEDIWESKSQVALPDQIIRALVLMSDQLAINDLKMAGLKNDLVEMNPKYKKVNIRVIVPGESLQIADSLDFNPKDVARMIDIGYNNSKIYTK